MTAHDPPRASVVIPVKDAPQLLEACLHTIQPELRETDELIVVDDGSRDATLDVARRYATRVLALEASGPYAARNLGWRDATGDIIFFVDVRCRARRGWLSRMLQAFADPSVAMTCTTVQVLGGATLAARAAAQRQPFRAENYLQRPFFMPYFPTCNLAVRRGHLQAVGGFHVIRSGGDADLCWRIQLEGLGRLHGIDEPLMDWVPRSQISDYLGQFYRYGRGGAALRLRYQDRGCSVEPPRSLASLAVQAAAACVAMVPGSPIRTVAWNVLTSAAQDFGYRRGLGAAGHLTSGE